jgi:hypothetical protein
MGEVNDKCQYMFPKIYINSGDIIFIFTPKRLFKGR